tara:strand:- start:998 stop:3919 length:2922 start_codon:yes stop_codon:yes gene_type:complete
MANEIIKVYDTEANALANGSTGRINPLNPANQGAIAGIGGMISNIGYGVGTIPYFIYKKYYYRIEANEPVSEFHIDWDDGEDNSSTKANIEIIKLDAPSFTTVTSHIYTEHKHFFPLFRVKNVDGFLSKWYTSDEATNDYSGLESLTLSAGQNEFSPVSEEKAETDRISTFLPSNLPPIGVLKADKKRIYSGIDNDAILSSYAYPLFYTYSTSTSSTKPNVVFTVQDDNGAVREHEVDGAKILSSTSSWTIGGASSNLATSCVPAGNYVAGVPAAERQKIIIKGNGVPGTTPTINTDLAWTSNTGSGNKYFDIHYEATDNVDANGNTHCRIFFYGGSNEEGKPSGATVPDGYSSLKVALPSAPGATATLIGNMQDSIDAFLGPSGSHTLTIDEPVVDGDDLYAIFTISGEGPCTNPSASNIATTYLLFNEEQSGGTVGATSSSVKKLLKVELDNAKELSDTDRVYVKVFDPGVLLGAEPLGVTTDLTVAVLSNGDPIVDLSDDSVIVHLDGAESRTRASNIDISTYNFDEDKLNNLGPVQATDSGSASDLMSGTFTGTGSKKVSYCYSNIGDSFDSDSRFYNTHRLPRLQVKDNMTDATTANAKDSLTYSPIEHFARSTYTATAAYMPSDLETRGLLLYSNRDTELTATWNDISARNTDDTLEIIGGSSSYQLRDSSNLTDHPRNHLFIAKTDKFDRIFFRMNNTNIVAESNWPPSVVITAYYANGTTWEPLEIIDETQGLQTSGSIKFTTPHDWYKGQYTHIDSGAWGGPIQQHGDEAGTAPSDLWDFNAYGLLISFTVKGSSNNETKFKCMNVWPYNNSHSQLVEVVDSHHISLNDITLAQSISFGRSAKVISVEDKFGKADIRKIGASGGSITLGGIDLGGSVDDRKTLVGYQKNGTPVFYDISHKSGDITRFFGVITRLTEDHPAGLMYPKWAVTLQTSHVLELSSDGTINSDKISIGGALVDDGKYLL